MDRLLLRLFEQEEDLHIYLLIDRSASMRLGGKPDVPLLRRGTDGRMAKLGYAAQITAALAYVGLANLDRVAIYGLGERLSPSCPRRVAKVRFFKVFDFLANLKPDGQTDLKASIGEFVQRIEALRHCDLLSDFTTTTATKKDSTCCATTASSRRRSNHRSDRSNPPLRGFEIVDMETGELREVTLSQSLIGAYQREHQSYCDALAAFLQKPQRKLHSRRNRRSLRRTDVCPAPGVSSMTPLSLFGLPWNQLLPIAAAGSAVLTVLYVLRQRRRRLEVPFSPLWQKCSAKRGAEPVAEAVAGVVAAFAACHPRALTLSLGDPRLGRSTEGRSLVLLIDASASMQAQVPTAAWQSDWTWHAPRQNRSSAACMATISAVVVGLDGRPAPLGGFSDDERELLAATFAESPRYRR